MSSAAQRESLGVRGRYIAEMLTELCAQDVVIEDAAAMIGTTVGNAKTYAQRLRLKFRTDAKRRRDARYAAIREGYAKGLTPGEIAAIIGSTPKSVMVIACKLGVSRTPLEAAQFRRGFAVPDELREDYRALTRKGCYRSREAAIALGLIVEA